MIILGEYLAEREKDRGDDAMATGVRTGKCVFCDETLSKGAIRRHLNSCARREETASDGDQSVFHLLIEGRGAPDYWMHVEIGSEARLKDLDDFLRETWLECCGHLSAFTIDGISYASSPMSEYSDESMAARLREVLSPKLRFEHQYDFGSTTELTLKVVAEQQGIDGGNKVRLLARNDPSELPCEVCGMPATQACAECSWSGGGLFCDDCGEDHDCGEDMFLPLVNSPRSGVCGYTG